MKGLDLRSSAASGEVEASREVRWRARRKEHVVLRLLRGESLDLLPRETAQPAARIAGWREEFLTAGREGLKSRPRSAACEQRRRRSVSAITRRRPGPVGAMNDGELLAEIRVALADSPLVGDGTPQSLGAAQAQRCAREPQARAQVDP
jgi:hypothetical protein